MSERIRFTEKFGYGLGDLASNLFWMQFVWFLNYFYTDVFGLAPAVLGTMILAVRIWDSVNDPIIGIIADRTQTKWGKFRPYLFWGAIPFAIVGTLTFTTPNLSPTGKLIYAYITYASMVLIYTVVNIPYSALMGVVSSDSKVRTGFSQMRFIMAFTGGLVVQAATLPLIAGFGSGDASVIQAELQEDQSIIVQEQGNGTSLLTVTAVMPGYEKPNLIKKAFDLVDEKDLGKFVRKQTFYVNTPEYFKEADIPFQESLGHEDFNEIRFLTSGFEKESVSLAQVFPEDVDTFKDLDLTKARLEVEVVNEQKGFQWAIAVFATTAAILFFITFATTKERVSPPVRQKTNLVRDVTDLLTNIPWLILFILGIVTLFHVCLRNGAIIYYFKYNVNRPNLATMFMLSGTFANLASMFIVGYIEKGLGKKWGYAVTILLTTVLTFAFYFLPDDNIPLLLVVHIAINFSFGPTAALIWAMYTDAADYSEWRTGRRATGLVMSACTMAQKFGYTFGGAFAMWVLTTIGYQANVAQSEESLAGIKAMVSWHSAIPCLIGFILMLFYPLTDKKLKVIEADLKERRQAEDA